MKYFQIQMYHDFCFYQDTFSDICWGQNHIILKDLVSYNTKRISKLLLNSKVPTLPFWTEGPRFERATAIHPFLPEISHFEMILAWMSGIYEFFNLITLFTNSMWKYWLLVTKIGANFALGHHLRHGLSIRVNKNTYCFGTSKGNARNKFKNRRSLWFLNHKSIVELNRLLLKFVLLRQVDIQKSSLKSNARFAVRIIWENKISWRVCFSGFQRA